SDGVAPLNAKLDRVRFDAERFVSSSDTVLGEPTTAAALSVLADCASGSKATPATIPLVLEGLTSPPVPVNVMGSVPCRSPSPAPSVGTNCTAIVHDPPPPVTTRPAQLSAPIVKSVMLEML